MDTFSMTHLKKEQEGADVEKNTAYIHFIANSVV